MSDYPKEEFPYVFVCPWCEAKQKVTRREAIDLGGHLSRASEAAEFALAEKHGWTLATPRALVCSECAAEAAGEGSGESGAGGDDPSQGSLF